MKTAKEHYEEYIAKIGSSTINLRKLYEDAFEKGKQEKIDFAIDILEKLGKSTSLTSATMMLEIEIHKLKQLDNAKETT